MRECLSYGAVSRRSLQSILSDLKRRRKDQFLSRYCYQIEKPSVLKKAIVPKGEDVDQEEILCDGRIGYNHWYTIPSVKERLTSLNRALPISHVANAKLRELLSDLGIHSFESESKQALVDFSVSFQKLKAYTKAHQLHESLLTQCTIDANPIPCQRFSSVNHSSTTSSTDPSSLSLTLEHYIGDVLCACYLMGNCISAVVESGTTHLEWTRHILSLINSGNTVRHAKTWYKLYVYLHSAILRTFPFTPMQAKTLLGSTYGIRGRSIPEKVEYIHPHYCYIGTETHVVYETTKVVRTVLLKLGYNPHLDGGDLPPEYRVAHQTTMTRFGPLGPAFRGRDEVRTVLMPLLKLLHRLHHPHFVVPTTWFQLSQSEHTIIDSSSFHKWFTGDDVVLSWMLELKRVCAESRPLTVMPPIVTVEPVPLSYLLQIPDQNNF